MPGVRLLRFFKTITEARGHQRRAAFSPSPAPDFHRRAALRVIVSGAWREVRGSE